MISHGPLKTMQRIAQRDVPTPERRTSAARLP